MRYESAVTSLSWIPSEAVTGGTRAAFDAGVTRYDEPPPDELGDVETLRAEDRFRFANVLKAFIDVDDGRITGSGYAADSRGLVGSSLVRLAGGYPGPAAVSRRRSSPPRASKHALEAGKDEIFRPGSLPSVGPNGLGLQGAGQRYPVGVAARERGGELGGDSSAQSRNALRADFL
jgi:hypothetical protein